MHIIYHLKACDNEINTSVKIDFYNDKIYSFVETPNEQQFESFYNFYMENSNINCNTKR